MESNSICFLEFASSKKETFSVHSGLKQWNRRIRQTGVKVKTATDLLDGAIKESKLLILPNPNRKFTAAEYGELKNYVMTGGSLLILLSGMGEKESGSNINYFLEEFGISVNADCVIRPSFVKVNAVPGMKIGALFPMRTAQNHLIIQATLFKLRFFF